jgi:hypothetical protein
LVWAQVHHTASNLPRLAQDCLCFSVWFCALAWRTQWRILKYPSSMSYPLLSGRCLRRRCPHLSLLPVCSCYSSLSIQRLSLCFSLLLLLSLSLSIQRLSISLSYCTILIPLRAPSLSPPAFPLDLTLYLFLSLTRLGGQVSVGWVRAVMTATTRARFDLEPAASKLEESVRKLREECGYEEVSELPR